MAVHLIAVLGRLFHARERLIRRHEATRRRRRAEREQQWQAMIRGEDEPTPAP